MIESIIMSKLENLKTKQVKATIFTKNVLWGIIICLICALIIIIVSPYSETYNWIDTLLIPIMSAIIAGFIVSFTIDIKQHVTDIHELIINSFTKNKFIEHLTDNQIQKLRQAALKQLIKSQYPEMQEGLVEKDREIFHALTNPYYESFSETNIFYRNRRFAWIEGGPEEPVLFKNVDLHYTIKSPKSNKIPTTVDLSICKSLIAPKEFTNDDNEIKRLWNIKEFSVTIDNGEETIITDDLKYQVKDLSSIDNYYNKSVRTYYNGNHKSICMNGDDNELKPGVFLTFKQSVEVHINYDIYLPIEDNHYANRLKYPAKSFSITCFCDDDSNVKFYGELLGTFVDSSELKITHPADHILTIVASNWLLPKNGVVIMMCEKNKKYNGN